MIIINNKSKVYNNIIEKSRNSRHPFLYFLYLFSLDGMEICCIGQGNVCNPDIEKNEIKESKLSGIHIQGDNSNPKITNNIVVNNKKCGVKLTDNSKVDVLKENKIKKNYNQGILIVEGCSAIITHNVISQNLKANIAYGGLGSQHTKIGI